MIRKTEQANHHGTTKLVHTNNQINLYRLIYHELHVRADMTPEV